MAVTWEWIDINLCKNRRNWTTINLYTSDHRNKWNCIYCNSVRRRDRGSQWNRHRHILLGYSVLCRYTWTDHHGMLHSQTNKQHIVIVVIATYSFCILIRLNDGDKSIRCTRAVDVRNNLCNYNAKCYILVHLWLRLWQLLSCNDVTCTCKQAVGRL